MNLTFHELRDQVLAAPLRCHSRRELWHAYLSHIKPGDECLEFGVATGRSINDMASMRPRTRFWGFDSFDGLPEAWGRVEKGRFRVDVKKIKFEKNVKIQVGLFEETLPGFLQEHPLPNLRGIHIDCDLGSSTTTILKAMSEQLTAKKPLLLFDEFYNYTGYEDHEFRSFLEWVNSVEIEFLVLGRNIIHKQVLIQLL